MHGRIHLHLYQSCGLAHYTDDKSEDRIIVISELICAFQVP
jgi:hypothetical protein